MLIPAGPIYRFTTAGMPGIKISKTQNAAPTALPPMILRRVAVRFSVLARRV